MKAHKKNPPTQKIRTVHLVGAQKTNYPWGFENRLIPVFRELDYELISTDFRQEKDQLVRRLLIPADVVLICKGEGIPPELLRQIPCPVILWWPELLGSPDEEDELALQKRNLLACNVAAYDYVFVHDEAGIPVCRKLGARQVGYLPTAAVDPQIHQKLDIPKKYDIGFVGQLTPRRKSFLKELEKHFPVSIQNIWGTRELNRFFNECKIVLNIHSSRLLNTETRLCEVLGSGSFLLSEEISSPDLFRDEEHLAYWKRDDLEDLIRKIDYYLNNEKLRETIAEKGYRFAHSRHTITRRVRDFIKTAETLKKRIHWPNEVLGVLYDKDGTETDDPDSFYKAVADSTDVDSALAWANKHVQHSGWAVSKRALRLLMETIQDDVDHVIEFGSGFSTLFLTKLFDLKGKKIHVTSFEHQDAFYQNLRQSLISFADIQLNCAGLKQLTDQEYEHLFSSDHPLDIYPDMGSEVPKSLYSQTRLHNVFYDKVILPENQPVGLVILDGPNGNGRSICFPLLKEMAEPPFYMLVDDMSHYPYLEEMARIFKYEILFEENFGRDACCLVRVKSVNNSTEFNEIRED